MKFIFSRFLIGTIVIVIGAYILLQYVFHIYIPALAYTPVFTIVVALLIIAWGSSMIFGRGFYASKIILGLFVIGTGIYVLVRYCFNINMPFILYTPIFRMIIGMIIIFLGVYILLGAHYVGDNIPKNKKSKYNVYFKTRTIDLSDLEIDRNRCIDVNTVFITITMKWIVRLILTTSVLKRLKRLLTIPHSTGIKIMPLHFMAENHFSISKQCGNA